MDMIDFTNCDVRKIRRKDKDVLPKPRRYFTGRNAIPGQRKNAFCRLNSIYRTGRLARKAQQFGSGMEFPLQRFWGIENDSRRKADIKI